MGGIKHCEMRDFGMAAYVKSKSETRKYSVTCRFFKYFNCRLPKPGSRAAARFPGRMACTVNKSAKCVRVCRAASWAGCDHSGGHCAPLASTCTSDCKLDGFSPTLFCAIQV